MITYHVKGPNLWCFRAHLTWPYFVAKHALQYSVRPSSPYQALRGPYLEPPFFPALRASAARGARGALIILPGTTPTLPSLPTAKCTHWPQKELSSNIVFTSPGLQITPLLLFGILKFHIKKQWVWSASEGGECTGSTAPVVGYPVHSRSPVDQVYGSTRSAPYYLVPSGYYDRILWRYRDTGDPMRRKRMGERGGTCFFWGKRWGWQGTWYQGTWYRISYLVPVTWYRDGAYTWHCIKNKNMKTKRERRTCWFSYSCNSGLTWTFTSFSKIGRWIQLNSVKYGETICRSVL